MNTAKTAHLLPQLMAVEHWYTLNRWKRCANVEEGTWFWTGLLELVVH